MTLLLPDELLESLLCSSCHKFLSVGPVEVYSNRRMKCGRCTEESEEVGVVSLFGIIGEHSLFKCINRFDGCRKLLKYSQVRDHETRCRSKSYQCPLCPNFIDLPTYLMIEHFKGEHPTALLQRPTFNIDSTDWSGSTSTFLYRKGNSLFFVSYKVDAVEEFLLLKIFLLGGSEDAGKMKHTFFIRNSCEAETIRTDTCYCIPYDFGDYEGLRVDVRELQYSQMINVEFDLDIDGHENLLEMPPSTECKSTRTDLIIPLVPIVQKVDKYTNTNSLYSEPLTAFERFYIWGENSQVLLWIFLGITCLMLCIVQLREDDCSKNLAHARQSGRACEIALKQQQQQQQQQQKKSCFLDTQIGYLLFFFTLIFWIFHFSR